MTFGPGQGLLLYFRLLYNLLSISFCLSLFSFFFIFIAGLNDRVV
jgi:hypothetical protein